MSDDREAEPKGRKATLRRWLWLDRSARRSDRSEANRGFYSGGPPVYTGRRPVGLRFLVPVVALGVVIALVILMARDADAGVAATGQAGPGVVADLWWSR